jgi:hypothetical protein
MGGEMFGSLTDQLVTCFEELMVELREIRGEISLLRNALEEGQPHPTLRPVAKPVAKKTAARRST